MKAMKQTPLNRAINEITDGKYLPDGELRWVIATLQYLLPYKEECIKEPITIIAPQLCFMLPGDVEIMAQDYFDQTFTK